MFKDKRFCSEVFHFLRREALVPAGSRVVLAVSGGKDSLVLLDFFRRFAAKFKLDIAVAHFDHQLRPESREQALALQTYCEELGLTFLLGQADTYRAHQNTAQSSLEAVARKLRYGFLEDTLKELDYTHLATGHHAGDQVETLFMRLIRGSVSNLGGMRPRSERAAYTLIRPFLEMPAQEIVAYHQFHHLPFWEDSSNAETSFFRNRLRHTLLPLIQEENANLERALPRSMQLWRDESDCLQMQAERLFRECSTLLDGACIIGLDDWEHLHIALQRRILVAALSWLCGDWRRFTKEHIEALISLVGSDNQKVLRLPLQVVATKTREGLFLKGQV